MSGHAALIHRVTHPATHDVTRAFGDVLADVHPEGATYVVGGAVPTTTSSDGDRAATPVAQSVSGSDVLVWTSKIRHDDLANFPAEVIEE